MGGQEFPAKVLGYDEDRDVAVLQLVFGDGEPVSSYLTACTCQAFESSLGLPITCHCQRTMLHIILGH